MDYTLRHGDCLEVMATMADNSVDAIVTDPPYFKVKSEWWDHQWDKPEGFLAWIDQLAAQWARILKPNGSLYCFASPRMAARVEVKLGERLNVLNHITWEKERDRGKHRLQSKEIARMYSPNTERIIFCEHYGADNIAKGEAGYGAKCDELRGFVFEPLRAYLDGERQRAGFTTRQVAEAFQLKSGSRTVTGMAGHWFTSVQWTLPTAENYRWLQNLFNANGSEYLRREYEDLRREYEDLRREYEDLRREYEDLRRPFSVSADVPYTDVWTFPTVQHYPGKHPCEKPAAMLEHIITASTRPGAVVLDCFAGSGATLLAAKNLGRFPIGIEIDDHWVQVAKARLKGSQPPQRPTRQPAPASPSQLALFLWAP
jgi:site-specific DNA-methyltransferase (adenine-specific)